MALIVIQDIVVVVDLVVEGWDIDFVLVGWVDCLNSVVDWIHNFLSSFQHNHCLVYSKQSLEMGYFRCQQAWGES